ncbi:MAG: hypothetical protein ABIH70_06915 [Chloroflexota bacterium]
MEFERDEITEVAEKTDEDDVNDASVISDLPENCHYRDEGCELARSCLNCPFPRCVYDEAGGKRRWLKRLRAREMSRLFNIEKKGIKELALMFGVSERTVQRALKVARNEVYGGMKENGRRV